MTKASCTQVGPVEAEEKNQQMNDAVKVHDFEPAALLPDEIAELEKDAVK